MPFFSYPLRLPGWKIAVGLGVPIRADVAVAFDAQLQRFKAICYDFDHKNPIEAEAGNVQALQRELDAKFCKELKRAFPKDPLMPPHLSVTLTLVASHSAEYISEKTENSETAMLPRCCSARAFMQMEEVQKKKKSKV